MGEAIISSELKYRAFISYSHADRAGALWLLKRLQTYRVPGVEKGAFRAKLGDFFMDRESLPVAHSLSQVILESLRGSESLIVLCSPEAAQSGWVRREIETFRELRPEADIFAVILSGDPASNDPETACFPAQLTERGQEPLAADLRKHADGRKLGFLKLASALSGTRLEDLLRRDHARQRRRVIGVTAAASVISLGMTALAGLAFTGQKAAEQARLEAERQREDAGDLVDFMLRDLRLKLQPIGRLDILDDIGAKALSYYEHRDDETLTCDGAILKARSFHLSNEAAVGEFRFDEAAAHAEAAFDLLHSKKSQCTSNPDMIKALSDAEAWRVNPSWRLAVNKANKGDPAEVYHPYVEEALAGYQRGLEFAEQIGDHSDSKVIHAREVTDAYLRIGQANLYLGDSEAADEAFLAALTIISPFAREDGADVDTLGSYVSTLSWLARIADSREDWRSATEFYQEAREIYERLAAPTVIRDWNQYRWALAARFSLIRIEVKSDPSYDFKSDLSNLISDAEALVENDAANKAWARFYDDLVEFEIDQ